MVSITLSVPEDVKRKMDQFPEMNWSGFIRKVIEQKTTEMSWKEEMLEKLKKEEVITTWATQLQRKTRKSRCEELRKKGLL